MSAFPTMSMIFDAVEDDYELAHGLIMGRGRTKRVAEARQIGMLLARAMPSACGRTRSFPIIGEAMNRHHTSVLHGATHVTERMRTDPELARTVARIRDRLEVFG